MIKRLALRYLPEILLMPLRRVHYRRVLRDFSPEEEPDVLLLRELVREGDTVIDVGANIGVYTKFLSAAAGPSGKVFSIEPIPSTFDTLRRNVLALDLRNVEPLNVAVDERPGKVTMELPRDAGVRNIYQARIRSGETREPESELFEVTSASLDSLFADHPRAISAIKIDVEGVELACIRGSTELLERHHPALLIEVSGTPDEPGSSTAELFSLLESFGYQPYWFDGTVLRPRAVGDSSVNYFFLTAAHYDTVPQKMRSPVA